MKKNLPSAIALALTALTPVLGQAQSIGLGTPTPHPSAALEVRSAGNNQGFLPPRLTYAQRITISNPAAGLLVYQSDTNASISPAAPAGYYFYSGTTWLPLAGQSDNLGNHTATQNLNLGSNQLVGFGGSTGLSVAADGRVGLGATAPQARFEVQAGADHDGTTTTAPALAFAYRSGGYRHWLRSRHNSTPTADGNAVDFYLSNSTSDTGSAAPGTGSTLALSVGQVNGQPRIGIGTASPSVSFQVSGSSNRAQFDGAVGLGTAPTSRILTANGEIMATGPGGALVFAEKDNNPQYWAWYAQSNVARLYCNNRVGPDVLTANVNGRVGINNINPQAALHVTGTMRVDVLASGGSRVVVADGNGTISGVTYASLQDNLGNHTATRNLNLATHKLVGHDGTQGVSIGNSGAVTLGGLAGSSTRMVTADASGTLSTQPIPTVSLQNGLVAVGSSGSYFETRTVTFPTPFASAPRTVVCTVQSDTNGTFPNNNMGIVAHVRNVTTTGFTVAVSRTDGNTGWGTAVSVSWLALP